MQTFTLTTGRWLQRLIGRNPIVRGSDRLEAGALVVVLIVALLALPLAGAVGTAVFDARTHTAAGSSVVFNTSMRSRRRTPRSSDCRIRPPCVPR
ncbi:hypothetical protein [Mycolicibacterium pallens]|uniref:Uncharacterized protein n=1 Tax=Mycolicibacterium pallens TaxID=370524 RepID=A0ABX8VMV9_9MYCO|nr:hypothetical protein [Mycolicibacterium pallens]QYL19140.1 hypothetical protein K0O64_11995 [Mycolicibacterium pallens]